jgi:2-hydroxycyclohexanecarboxyl-CoA dehydrogenase
MASDRILGNPATGALLARSLDPARDTAAICFSARGAAPFDPLGAHAAILEGVEAAAQLLQAERESGLRSLVLIADDDGSATAAMVASFAAGFGKTLARELARAGMRVNAVGGDLTEERSVAASASFLLSNEAAFITGQSFGSAGARLAAPQSRPKQVPASGWLLVSGGAGAIGSAVTRRLHRDGWKILIGHRGRTDADELARSLSSDASTCCTVSLDVEDLGQIEAFDPGQVIDEPLAGVVMCSGWNLTHPFWLSEAAEWDRTLRINFTGPALLARQLVRAKSPGIVVAIGSEAGRAGDAGRAVYAGAKAAIARFTAELSARYDTIRAITVAPGPVDTPLLRGTHGEDAAEVEKGLEKLARLIPLGRMGLPDEIAAAVSFATSPAGQAVDGEIISVGGGITMQ